MKRQFKVIVYNEGAQDTFLDEQSHYGMLKNISLLTLNSVCFYSESMANCSQHRDPVK